MDKTKFDFLLEGVPYFVTAEPFTFNQEPRFRVRYNDSPEYIFAWDEEALRFLPIGDDSSTIPNELEEVIARKLYT
ncbi:hypothetical protein SAMN05518672_102694 [Chitinophaga sp. CF118]|uniref:hypothetical protein n=1 Tax=Chitinophaga sp. CF118 TaxID=1884367 RepID=UPI0008F3DA00|nr:hypothetical protein [Chitinophaga sp. CF118]SFD63010.1 hypothetical protein SAMN05518672_102694 [Chitinophaga sp. CF118]